MKTFNLVDIFLVTTELEILVEYLRRENALGKLMALVDLHKWCVYFTCLREKRVRTVLLERGESYTKLGFRPKAIGKSYKT